MRALALLAAVICLSLQPTVNAQDAKLRNGDTVEVKLGGVPAEDIGQVSAAYTIDGQGNINLPHIGRVRAAGSTQDQLQSAIENAYKAGQIYTNPSISVSVASAARFVNVSGEVKSPHRVEFTADLTLLSAITACGGFTDYADQKKVRFIRDGQATQISIPELRKDPSKDIRLKPGDSIEVPQSWI